jgi:hypothetical protein
MYDVWHDRALFHFLIEPQQRQQYVEAVTRTVAPRQCVRRVLPRGVRSSGSPTPLSGSSRPPQPDLLASRHHGHAQT